MKSFASFSFFLLLTAIASVQSFTPPKLSSSSLPIFGLGAILFRPKNLTLNPNEGDDEQLVETAKFFTAAFWAGKAGGAAKLSPTQVRSLSNSQIAEFRKRYGGRLLNKRDAKSEIIICKNSENNQVYGCAGIEVSKISTPNGKSVDFSAPLMSNLAVGKQVRRKGIAEDLVKATEDLARLKWGYNEVYLYVEKQNTPALKLYKKLGYKVQWEDDTATTLIPTAKGNIVTQPTVILCMKKNLGAGFFGRFFG